MGLESGLGEDVIGDFTPIHQVDFIQKCVLLTLKHLTSIVWSECVDGDGVCKESGNGGSDDGNRDTMYRSDCSCRHSHNTYSTHNTHSTPQHQQHGPCVVCLLVPLKLLLSNELDMYMQELLICGDGCGKTQQKQQKQQFGSDDTDDTDDTDETDGVDVDADVDRHRNKKQKLSQVTTSGSTSTTTTAPDNHDFNNNPTSTSTELVIYEMYLHEQPYEYIYDILTTKMS